jgi:hypothetical protein
MAGCCCTAERFATCARPCTRVHRSCVRIAGGKHTLTFLTATPPSHYPELQDPHTVAAEAPNGEGPAADQPAEEPAAAALEAPAQTPAHAPEQATAPAEVPVQQPAGVPQPGDPEPAAAEELDQPKLDAEEQEDEEMAAALFGLAAAAEAEGPPPARAASPPPAPAFVAAAFGAGPQAQQAQQQAQLPSLQYMQQVRGGGQEVKPLLSPRKRPRKPSKALAMYEEFSGELCCWLAVLYCCRLAGCETAHAWLPHLPGCSKCCGLLQCCSGSLLQRCAHRQCHQAGAL